MLWEQHHRESDSIEWLRKWSQSFGTSFSFTFLFFLIYYAVYVQRNSPTLMSRIIKIQTLPQPYFNFKSYKRETAVKAQVVSCSADWVCRYTQYPRCKYSWAFLPYPSWCFETGYQQTRSDKPTDTAHSNASKYIESPQSTACFSLLFDSNGTIKNIVLY